MIRFRHYLAILSQKNRTEALGLLARRDNRDMTSTLEASIRMGAMNGGMRNICELLLNVVMLNRQR
jgi:hypothetical protein